MNPIGLHTHEDKLLEFAYGELPPSEARAMEAHVKGCARCTGALESIRGVRGVMAQLAPEPAPDAGLESLLAYAQQATQRGQAARPPKRIWWRRWIMPVSGLAAAALVALVMQQTVLSPEKAKESLEATAAKQELAQSDRKVDAPKAAPMPAREPAPAAPQVLPVASANSYPQQLAKNEAPPPPQAQAKAQLGARTIPEGETGASYYQADSAKRAKKVTQVARRDVATKLDAEEPAPASATEYAAEKSVAQDDSREEFADLAGKARGAAKDAEPAAKGKAASAGDDDFNSLMGSRLSMRGVSSGSAPGRARPTDKAAEVANVAQQVAMPSTAAPAAAPVAAQPKPAPKTAPVSARTLLAQADAAARAGDREGEVRLLRQAVAAGPSRAELEQLLTRLCNAEADAGLEPTGCEQLAREFPNSAGAQLAQRKMRAAMPEAKVSKAIDAESVVPAQRAPAAPMKAKAKTSATPSEMREAR